MVTQHCFPPGATSAPIGRPEDNVHCYVVDAHMQAVPVGVPGELLLSGPRMFKGAQWIRATF